MHFISRYESHTLLCFTSLLTIISAMECRDRWGTVRRTMTLCTTCAPWVPHADPGVRGGSGMSMCFIVDAMVSCKAQHTEQDAASEAQAERTRAARPLGARCPPQVVTP